MIVGRNVDKQKELFSGEFGKQFLIAAKKISAPLFWYSKKTGQSKVDDSGTCFFLVINKVPMIVTAAHVYEGYLAKKKELLETVLMICDLEIDLEERLISCGESSGVDIATFRTSFEEIDSIKKEAHYLKLDGLRDLSIEKNDRLLLAGFPGCLREHKDDFVKFGAFMISPLVSSVSENYCCFVLDRENYADPFGNGYPEKFSFGGMSGSAVYRVTESTAGLISWALIGVVSDGHDDFEIVQTTLVEKINLDGTINMDRSS